MCATSAMRGDGRNAFPRGVCVERGLAYRAHTRREMTFDDLEEDIKGA